MRARQALYFARREPWPPLSPVLRLLRGIHELEPRRARWILRNRIFSTASAGPACAGAVRLAARQLSAGVAALDHGLPLPALPFLDAGAAGAITRRCSPEREAALGALVAGAPRAAAPAELARLALSLASEIGRHRASGRADPPIAALLASAQGELLGFATSAGSRNPTAHAEANLADDWLHRTRAPLPAGASVVATLKPCKMCAGLLWEAAADPWSLRVFYVAHDPRRYARETVLDAGSMARRRVAASAAQLTLPLQFQIGASPLP